MKDNLLRAFITAELAAALAAVLFLIPPSITALKYSMTLYRQYSDSRIAERRAETVAAILNMPIRWCGAGMPMRPEEYKKAFGAKALNPFNWDGPISVTAGKSGEENGMVKIAYAYPAGTRTSAETSANAHSAAVSFIHVPNSDYFDLNLFDKSRSVKNWVIFHNIHPLGTPLTVTGASGKTLVLKSYTEESFAIPKNESLLLFRALECYALNDILYTRDFRTAGDQPRENGVCGIRFRLDAGKNMITVFLMVRGDDTSLAPGKIRGGAGWPSELLEEWRQYGSRYVLYAYRFDWVLSDVCIKRP